VVAPGRMWHALEDDEVVGRADVLRRPDGRTFVAVDAWHADVGAELLETVVRAMPEDLYSIAGEDDAVQLALLGLLGFAEVRREDEYVVPVVAGDSTAPGCALVSARDIGVAQLARLDDELRQDVPGAGGWENDLAEFAERTFDPRLFDPRTYLVAVDDRTGELAGLVRIWRASRVPRLGLVAVRRPYRRRGLATALLHAAFRPLAARGLTHVTAEADATNVPSRTLLARFGARRTGGTVELRRPADRPRDRRRGA
jgi:RimJ/RimL family protein N-acetyltransferase